MKRLSSLIVVGALGLVGFPGCGNDYAASVVADAGSGPTPVEAGTVPEAGASCDSTTSACIATKSTTAAGAVSTDGATFTTPIVDITDGVIDTDTGFIGRRRGDGTPVVAIRAAGADGNASGITYEVVDQVGGPKLAVFGFASLEIQAGAKLRVVGTNAVAFVSATNIRVNGELSLRGDCSAIPKAPGPGGFGPALPATVSDATPGSGGDSVPSTVGASMPQACGGNGGGGNGTDGDRGGDATNSSGNADRTSTGGNAGLRRRKSLFELPTLAGGAGGGGAGGPGGGAAGFVANGDIRIGGVVEAGGCGGKYANVNGASPSTCGTGGGGGGAGGTLLFEAPRLVVSATGRILAHGGAGGGGGDGTNGAPRPGDGADASAVDATPANGGVSSGNNPTFGCMGGGSGSPFAILSGPCRNNASNSVRGGGGGGGAGIIAARTIEAGILVDPDAIVSPAIVRNTVQTR